MSVYVDESCHPYGRMVMCHMMADSLDELHAMADRIGIQRRWFQNGRFPHYDICKAKRAIAVAAGAIENDSRTMVRTFRARQQENLTELAGSPMSARKLGREGVK